MFGRASFEDLTLKGYDIIANAIGSLDKMFELTFVGSSSGEHRKIERWFLDNTSISRNQITIRSYCSEQDELKTMFHQSDMVALPSRSEGFGLVALEAISAGITVLVAGESGIAEALQEVEGGKSVVVESDDAGEWAQRIQQLSSQSPEERQNNAKMLRENYNKKYSWCNECRRFQRMIQRLTQQPDALKVRIDVETMKPAEHNIQNRTPVSGTRSGRSPDGMHHEASTEPVASSHIQPWPKERSRRRKVRKRREFLEMRLPTGADAFHRTPVSATELGGSSEVRHQERSQDLPLPPGHAQSLSTGAEVFQAPNRIPTEGEVLRLIASNYLMTTPPKCKNERDEFLTYLKEMRVVLTGVDVGSLVLTVKCDSLQILKELWKDYSSGHLGKVVQRCFVTREILTELRLSELMLKTTISEKEYKAYKMYFEKESMRGQLESVAVLGKKPTHSTKEMISTQKDDDKGDSGYSSFKSSRSYSHLVSSVSKVPRKPDLKTSRHGGMQQIVREGLEMFDVSSPEGLQDYVTFFTNRMFSAGQESPTVKNFREVMDDNELKQFVSIHVKEGTWQVVEWLFDELLHCQGAGRETEREVPTNDEDAESDESKSLALTWWPTDEDQDLVTLCKVLTESDCKPNGLNLTGNGAITDTGIKHLAEVLTHYNCKLNSLVLRGNGIITDEAVKHLAVALTDSNCKLHSLDLSNNYEITDEGVKPLAKALTHSNCKLNSLKLSRNGLITDGGIEYLAKAFMHSSCKLTSIDLSSNEEITDEGVKHLAEALMHSNCSLNSLDVRHNKQITDAGVKHLAEALMHSNRKLNSLNLSWNRQITDAGVKHLAEALMHSNCKLNSLNFSYNDAITDAGVKHLAEALMHSNCSLNSLNLSDNYRITDAGVKHLANALMHSNCKLNSLNLSSSYRITDTGVKHLAEALMHSNYELRSVNRRHIEVTAKVKEHVSEEGLG
ncbi:uncharacterized protein LOC144632861 [Oculina patagonica]